MTVTEDWPSFTEARTMRTATKAMQSSSRPATKPSRPRVNLSCIPPVQRPLYKEQTYVSKRARVGGCPRCRSFGPGTLGEGSDIGHRALEPAGHPQPDVGGNHEPHRHPLDGALRRLGRAGADRSS